MRLRRLWLTDFRSYTSAELELGDGLTAVIGANGEGKSNLLEAIGWLATLSSFRGAPTDALVREGTERAVVRAEAERDGRELLIEAEIVAGSGRNRIHVNRQKLQRSRDLLGALRVSVFAPDDLAMVKGGPAERRRYLDDALVALHRRNDALRGEVDRILRQRNALLKQSGGRLTGDVESTLDVWDSKLAEAGEALARARIDLVGRLEPILQKAYDQVAGSVPERGLGRPGDVAVRYEAAWLDGGLASALATARGDELRRGISLVGPHRDELALSIGSLPARTHASQGEQRSLAFALRLAAHEVVTEATGTPPVLLLDDVFSELDPDRSWALLTHLPAGQTVLTTAGALPPDAQPERTVRIRGGRIIAA